MHKPISINGYKCHCERCGYNWISKNKLPVACARCKSRYWNSKRRLK